LRPSAELVIADAGPLIALSRVVELSLLRDVFGQVWLTETVLAECTARSDRPEGETILAAVAAGWLQVRPDAPLVRDWDLDPGEASAIAAALELQAGVLMDDRAGRRVASTLGLSVIGVLGVLVRGKELGRLPRIGPLVEQLVASRYYLAGKVIDAALRLVNE
jgi:predicted nucleic acid-binding protein